MYEKSVLPNGVRIVTESLPHVRSVTIGFWFQVGSRDEPPHQQGITHFIEHMLFKGTTSRSAKEIAEAMDATGGQLNAFTTKEHTCYYARVLDQHLPFAVELLADMVLNSRFEEDDMAKEKSVVAEEIRMYEDAPDELVHDLVLEAAWGNHPLGRSTLGTAESIQALTRDDLVRFVAEHYVAGNLVVAAAGNLNHQRVVELVESALSSLPEGAGFRAVNTVHRQSQILVRSKDTEQVHLCVGNGGVSRSDPDKYSMFVLDTILGGGMSSRLFQELREERGLVYSAYSYHSGFQETGLFTIYAGTSPANVGTVLSLIYDEQERLCRKGVTQQELIRAKEQLKGGLMLSLESTSSRMHRLAKAVLYREPLLTPDEIINQIESVTLEDVRQMAIRSFQHSHPAVAAIGAIKDEDITMPNCICSLLDNRRLRHVESGKEGEPSAEAVCQPKAL